MYYPYLRGKQFELLALRDFADHYGKTDLIVPIIEPVKASFNSIKLAIHKLQEKNIHFFFILNPQCGEVQNKIMEITNALEFELSDRDTWTPAFIVNNNYDKISETIIKKEYERVMIICKDGIQSDDSNFDNFIQQPYISKVVINSAHNSLRRKLSRLGIKDIICLEDNFKPQQRNSEYINVPEELFSDAYKYYEEEGFKGIADYTTLPSTFIDGGRLPYAIAIHMTYEKTEDQIFVRHFVSDTNDDDSNIQGKFGEAAYKAVTFFRDKELNNQAISELTQLYNESRYPGLGVIKKISIKNNIELMFAILSK
ncbi:MAG: sce7725 family protein [Tannerellaceae bacterium]|nr:sce7725 family protein [Tannerellaceae bacterium]